MTRPTSNSFPPPPPTQEKTIPETLKGDNNQRPDQNPSFDTKSDFEGADAVQTEEKVLEEAEKSSWLLKIIYNIVSGGELITKLVQVQQTIRISSQNHQTSSFKRIIKPQPQFPSLKTLTLKEEWLPLMQPVFPLNEKITKPPFLEYLAKSHDLPIRPLNL